jgi:hypothetical protein
MEAITAHALGIELLRNRVMIREGAMTAVEGCIEAGDLRQARKSIQNRPDRRQIVGLMQRRQGDVLLQIGEHAVIDQDRSIVLGTAVDDPMSDRNRIDVMFLAEPGSGGVQGRGHVGDLVAFEVLVHDVRAVGAARAQSWLRSDAVDLPFDLTGQISGACNGENLKLYTGGTGINDQDRIHGSSRRRQRRAGAARMCVERRDRARGHAGAHRISARCEDDRYACAQHDPRRIRLG